MIDRIVTAFTIAKCARSAVDEIIVAAVVITAVAVVVVGIGMWVLRPKRD